MFFLFVSFHNHNRFSRYSDEWSIYASIDAITENDKQDLKDLYAKAFKGLPSKVTAVYTIYSNGEPESHIAVDFRDWSVEDRYVGHTVSFILYKTYYGKYTGYINGLSYDPSVEKEGADGKPESDYGDFIRCFDLIAHHDINKYNSIEKFIASDDPLGEYDNGGLYSPAISYIGQYFAPEDRDHIVPSMVAFLEKGYKILNCTVSDPCYEPDRQMLYYNVAVTAADTDGHGLAVLQARMFYDYRGIYQPEVYSVAPNGCSAELLYDLQHFFGYELTSPVLTSKTDDLTEAKAVLDENGIRCRIQTGTNAETGEHDYNVLTSDEDAPEAADILKKIYNGNSGYESYEY